MSFLKALKREPSTLNFSSLKRSISENEIGGFLKTFQPNNKDKTRESKNLILTDVENNFLDHNGEMIYEFYYKLREYYKDSDVFQKIDYNGFLDIFLDNIHIDEIEQETDEEILEIDENNNNNS